MVRWVVEMEIRDRNSLMGGRWAEMGQTEQIGAFAVTSLLVLLKIYLAFSGLVV